MPQFFLDIAERMKREDPWWYRTCPDCLPAEDAEEAAFKERTRMRVKGDAPTGEPDLQPPLEVGEDGQVKEVPWHGPEPSAGEDHPF